MGHQFNPARVSGGLSHLVNVSWSSDKYPDMPEFKARAKLVILDTDGPAMITNIHATSYYNWGGKAPDSFFAGHALWIRIYYDNRPNAAVDMPLMDFLGDVDGRCQPYATQYFSKTRDSHNFYLTVPFEKHIRIEVENRSDVDLSGYMTLQVETLPEWDRELGYLYACYREEEAILPDDILALMNIQGNGALVAHWLQIQSECPLCRDGEYICEGNDEFYLDGEKEPSLEYLGTEDLYGFSWGFKGVQSDGRCAIIRQDMDENSIQLCMLRTRREDQIRFFRSCRLLINYQQEFFSAMCTNPRHREQKKSQIPIRYKSCCYYYKLEE